MKRLSIIIAAVALVLGMAQCKKEKQQQANENGDGQYVSVTAGHNDSAKTDIFPDGLVKWSAGDKLYVVGSTQGYLGCLTTVNYTTPSNYAEFGGNITAISGTQTIHFYYFGKQELTPAQITELGNGTYNYSITSQDGTLDGIENTMHLMHGVCADVEAGTTKFGNVTMHNMMALAKFDISGYYGYAKCTGPLTTAKLNLNSGTWSNQSDATPVTFTETSDECYMALIPGDNQVFSFSKPDGSDKVDKGNHSIGAGTLGSSNGESIPVKHGVVGALCGDFKVSASKVVKFSRGSLLYQASTNIWRFAKNQHDYVGDATYGTIYENGVKCNNALISSTYTGWIDLFGWGTSGQNHGAACYQPWESDGDNAKYYAYGDKNKNLYEDPGTADWGCNVISNGGNTANSGWSTLKADEWNYLLNERTVNGGTGVDKTYKFTTLTLANSTTVNGLLIAPEGFTGSLGSGTTTWNDWHNILEPAGVVFLPAAGLRRRIDGNIDLRFIGTDGLYWSGDEEINSISDTQAHNLWFNSGSFVPKDADARHYGHVVRLVYDITPSK